MDVPADEGVVGRLEAQHDDLEQGAYYLPHEYPSWDAAADAAAEILELRAWKLEASALLDDFATVGVRTMEALRAAERARDEVRALADLLAARCRGLDGLDEGFDSWLAARRACHEHSAASGDITDPSADVVKACDAEIGRLRVESRFLGERGAIAEARWKAECSLADQLAMALRSCAHDRPTAHTDEVWLRIRKALETHEEARREVQ